MIKKLNVIKLYTSLVYELYIKDLCSSNIRLSTKKEKN